MKRSKPTNRRAARARGRRFPAAPVLGERLVAILAAVRDTGSLNEACKLLRISYRDAWGKIRRAEAGLGVELTLRRTGGPHGGGSELTSAGERLVLRWREQRAKGAESAARSAAKHLSPGTAKWQGGRGERLVLATTTSIVDTGLLAALLGPFCRNSGIVVEPLAIGSGAALRLAGAGGADVVLTHAPEAEAEALRAGRVVNRRVLMANEFLVVGPRNDPAGVHGTRRTEEALRRIAASRCTFCSRGDESGTHQRERALFASAGIRPGAWHHREGLGMGGTLVHASESGGYTLTDRGTFAAMAERLSLEVLHRGGRALTNLYSLSATNPERFPDANYLGAMALIAWLTSPVAQEMIGAFRVGGRPVADPAAVRPFEAAVTSARSRPAFP